MRRTESEVVKAFPLVLVDELKVEGLHYVW